MVSAKTLVILVAILWILTTTVALRSGTVLWKAVMMGAGVSAACGALFCATLYVAVVLIRQALKNK